MDQIYTIPVKEAFEASTSVASSANNHSTCPFCTLVSRLNQMEVDQILGAAMMEPDIRIMTNKNGFCGRHFSKMLRHGKKLPLALMLESHLNEISHGFPEPGLLPNLSGKTAAKNLNTISESCYLCQKIDSTFQAMMKTAAYLWQTDDSFRQLAEKQPGYCLPHFALFLEAAKERMNGKQFSSFYSSAYQTEKEYLTKVTEDIQWFCKKFDYRYENEPWNDCQNAPEKAIEFLAGECCDY